MGQSWADERRMRDEEARRGAMIRERQDFQVELQGLRDASAMARLRFEKNFGRNNMTAFQRSMAELNTRKQLFTENLDARKFNEKRLADDRFTYKEFDENGIEQTRVGRYSDFEERQVIREKQRSCLIRYRNKTEIFYVQDGSLKKVISTSLDGVVVVHLGHLGMLRFNEHLMTVATPMVKAKHSG